MSISVAQLRRRRWRRTCLLALLLLAVASAITPDGLARRGGHHQAPPGGETGVASSSGGFGAGPTWAFGGPALHGRRGEQDGRHDDLQPVFGALLEAASYSGDGGIGGGLWAPGGEAGGTAGPPEAGGAGGLGGGGGGPGGGGAGTKSKDSTPQPQGPDLPSLVDAFDPPVADGAGPPGLDPPSLRPGSYDPEGGPEGRPGGPSHASAAPEPATWLALIVGFSMLGSMLRRARRLPAR